MRKTYKSVPEGEWIVLEILWKQKKPTPFAVIFEEYQKVKNLKRNTVQTYIARLIEKEIISFKPIGNTSKYVYFPMFSEDEMRANESKNFIETYLGGKSDKLILKLAQESNLSIDDLSELLKDLDKE